MYVQKEKLIPQINGEKVIMILVVKTVHRKY
jgi:hypothetical protein